MSSSSSTSAWSWLSAPESQILLAILLAAPFALVLFRSSYIRVPGITPPAEVKSNSNDTANEKPKTIMQAERTDLAPPKDDPFTLQQLKAYDGSDPSKPIYVSIKGTVFDVSPKADVYGRGRSYNIFAGKDGSRGLGKSSLKPEDCDPDYSVLNENDMKILNDWHAFFTKRYNIVGRVTDMPAAVANL